MDIRDLLDYLRMEGPHDLDYLPTASEKDAPPQVEESTDDEGDYREVKSAPMKVGSEEGGDYRGSTGGEETREEEDLEEDPEEDPEEAPEEDPEEDPSEGSQVGEEDPDDDFGISEAQLMESEDLLEDWEGERKDHTIQDEQARGPEDLEEEINSLWYRAECEIGVNRCRRGRYGQMCRSTYPLDAPDQ